MPSAASRYGIFAPEAAEAMMPCVSRPCIGLAPGANGSPLRRPAGGWPGVFPLAAVAGVGGTPWAASEVMVSADWGWIALRYVGGIRNLVMNIETTSDAS